MIDESRRAMAGDFGRQRQSSAILAEVQRRLEKRVNGLTIKGSGGVQVNGANGHYVISRQEEATRKTVGITTSDVISRPWYEISGVYPYQSVLINWVGPYISLAAGSSTTFNFPELSSLPLTWIPQPSIAVGSGVKIYLKFTAQSVGANFNDVAAPPATVSIANSLILGTVTIESGGYTYSPTSTAGTTSTGPPVGTTKTIYRFLLRVDSNGIVQPLSGAEQATEDANNPWTNWTPTQAQTWLSTYNFT